MGPVNPKTLSKEPKVIDRHYVSNRNIFRTTNPATYACIYVIAGMDVFNAAFNQAAFQVPPVKLILFDRLRLLTVPIPDVQISTGPGTF